MHLQMHLQMPWDQKQTYYIITDEVFNE